MSFSSYEKERYLFEKWRFHNEELVCTPCLEDLILQESNPDLVKLYKEEIEKNISLAPCNHDHDHDHDHDHLNEYKLVNNSGVLNNVGRRRKPIKFIVIHWTATRKWQDTVRVLNNRGSRGLSTHYEVDRQGNVHQYEDPATTVTYHAGSPWNAYSIGIDITSLGYKKAKCKRCYNRVCKRVCRGESRNARLVTRSDADTALTGFTPKQKTAVRKLVTTLCNRYNIPQVVAPDWREFRPKTVKPIIENGIGILRHRNLKKTGCPGWFPMDSLGQPFQGEINIEKVQGTYRPKTRKQKDAAVRAGTIVAVGGGHVLSSFKDKVPSNFDFNTFYDDLETFGKGVRKELPSHGKDYTFGSEHYAAWQRLQKNPKYLKGTNTTKTPETTVKENTFSSFKKEKLLFESWRSHVED